MEERPTVLLVDDRPEERRLLRFALTARWRVVEAGSREEALAWLDSDGADLIVLDLHLPPRVDTTVEGRRLLETVRERDPLVPVIVVTGDDDRRVALEIVERGVADFLLKPLDPAVLEVVASRALARSRLEREVRELRREVRRRYAFGRLVAESAAMRRVFERLGKLARASTSVLLLGESGTGKSAVARALHAESPRREGPFVVVDGASIPPSLLESELFGHVKGAFTGAESPRRGRIVAADGGTLFLDEIGNLSHEAQAKLLLFLDTREISPVGSDETFAVDVRLVAATNQDLDRLVREERFRADLLYRIQVATVVLPPLREREGDVVPLARHLLARLARESDRPAVTLADDAAGVLEAYPWPGNVRQLAHVLESSLVLADGDTLRAGDLVLPPAGSGASAETATAGSFKQRIAELERRLVVDALAATGGNKAAAGRLLALDENQIRYLCRKHRVD